MSNEGMISLFDQIDMEIGVVKEEKKEVKQESKVLDKTKKTTDVKTKAAAKKEDPNKKIEEECTKFEKIIVKYFSQEVLTIANAEEIKNIKLKDIQNKLVNELNFPELAEKIQWHMVPSSNDKKTGYLFVVGNFYAKG